MDKEYYKVEVIPFGEVNTRVSAEPRMLEKKGKDEFLSELPIIFHGYGLCSGPFKDKLFYLYNELTAEEQEKFKDKVKVITVTVPEVVKATDTRGKGR